MYLKIGQHVQWKVGDRFIIRNLEKLGGYQGLKGRITCVSMTGNSGIRLDTPVLGGVYKLVDLNENYLIKIDDKFDEYKKRLLSV